MPLKTHLDEQPSLNLTSMIDIVFNLMIFFMVGTRFTSVEQRIDVQVPQVSEVGTQKAAPPKMVIHVQRDGTILVDEDPLALEALAGRLRSARQGSRDLSVVVRGDGEGAFQHVAGVLAACRKAGVSDLGISVRVTSTAQRSSGTAGRGQGTQR